VWVVLDNRIVCMFKMKYNAFHIKLSVNLCSEFWYVHSWNTYAQAVLFVPVWHTITFSHCRFDTCGLSASIRHWHLFVCIKTTVLNNPCLNARLEMQSADVTNIQFRWKVIQLKDVLSSRCLGLFVINQIQQKQTYIHNEIYHNIKQRRSSTRDQVTHYVSWYMMHSITKITFESAVGEWLWSLELPLFSRKDTLPINGLTHNLAPFTRYYHIYSVRD